MRHGGVLVAEALDADPLVGVEDGAVPVVEEAAFLAVDRARPTEGEPIILLSNPQGSTWKVARGVVGRIWEFANTGSRLQITADVLPGSSGGPVINRRGLVVGIAVMRMDSGDNLNFAVPAASLQRLQTQSLTARNLPGH